MAKMLRIEKCSQCPHCFNGFRMGCNLAQKQITDWRGTGRLDEEVIPDFCPLPDAPEKGEGEE